MEETGSPNTVAGLLRFSDTVHISDQFVTRDNKPATILQFLPIESLYNAKPIRFWHIEIKFGLVHFHLHQQPLDHSSDPQKPINHQP